MYWIYLLIAGFFEIAWAIGLKYCDEIRINLPTIFVAISMLFSVVFLGLAIKQIPIGIAYAIWTSIGMIGVFIYGTLILKEPASFATMLFFSLILIGVVGLKVTSPSGD